MTTPGRSRCPSGRRSAAADRHARTHLSQPRAAGPGLDRGHRRGPGGPAGAPARRPDEPTDHDELHLRPRRHSRVRPRRQHRVGRPRRRARRARWRTGRHVRIGARRRHRDRRSRAARRDRPALLGDVFRGPEHLRADAGTWAPPPAPGPRRRHGRAHRCLRRGRHGVGGIHRQPVDGGGRRTRDRGGRPRAGRDQRGGLDVRDSASPAATRPRRGPRPAFGDEVHRRPFGPAARRRRVPGRRARDLPCRAPSRPRRGPGRPRSIPRVARVADARRPARPCRGVSRRARPPPGGAPADLDCPLPRLAGRSPARARVARAAERVGVHARIRRRRLGRADRSVPRPTCGS